MINFKKSLKKSTTTEQAGWTPLGWQDRHTSRDWGGWGAALTLQREWVRWWGELMSLGVDERSPSAAEASEMTEGWRVWQGLILTTADRTHTHTHTENSPPSIRETARKPSVSMLRPLEHQQRKGREEETAYPVCLWCVHGKASVGSDGWRPWAAGRPASPTPDCRSPQAPPPWSESGVLVRLLSEWPETASPAKHTEKQKCICSRIRNWKRAKKQSKQDQTVKM